MTTTNKQKAYTKLLYYFEKKIPVYFRLYNQFNQRGEPIYRVGLILDLSESKYTMVLKENVLGELPFLLEDIDYDSINTARARK